MFEYFIFWVGELQKSTADFQTKSTDDLKEVEGHLFFFTYVLDI